MTHRTLNDCHAAMQQITASGLKAQLAETGNPPLLLDVREPNEFVLCRIEGSINIPMNEIPGRLTEIDPQASIILICHHGIRSAMVADFLACQGYQNLLNLSGGIDAWAREVDASIPTY